MFRRPEALPIWSFVTIKMLLAVTPVVINRPINNIKTKVLPT